MNELSNGSNLRELARADAYRLLSACFYQPEAAFLEEDVFGQLVEALARFAPDRRSEAAAMDDDFRRTGVDALLLDYSRLFLGPFDILAKPYGSVYLEGESTVMGESTVNVLVLYKEAGFQVADDIREVPDHVALELEFLYLLSLRMGQATEEAEHTRLQALKRRFIEAHIGRWIGRLADAVKNGAETDFYKRLANLTEQVVLQDRQELSQEMGTG